MGFIPNRVHINCVFSNCALSFYILWPFGGLDKETWSELVTNVLRVDLRSNLEKSS